MLLLLDIRGGKGREQLTKNSKTIYCAMQIKIPEQPQGKTLSCTKKINTNWTFIIISLSNIIFVIVFSHPSNNLELFTVKTTMTTGQRALPIVHAWRMICQDQDLLVVLVLVLLTVELEYTAVQCGQNAHTIAQEKGVIVFTELGRNENRTVSTPTPLRTGYTF